MAPKTERMRIQRKYAVDGDFRHIASMLEHTVETNERDHSLKRGTPFPEFAHDSLIHQGGRKHGNFVMTGPDAL